MTTNVEFLRRASPGEQRTISREDVGFYNAVIVGATYDLAEDEHVDTCVKETYFRPLAACIRHHPWLCVTVGDKHTDKAFYQRVKKMNLSDHVFLYDKTTNPDASAAIAPILEENLNVPFPAGIPPWKIFILPLQEHRVFVGFAYSHTIGDGMSGTIFHRTFLDALLETFIGNRHELSAIETPARPLPDPFDTPERLTISWSFLLKPLLATLLPSVIADILGVRASASTIDEGTWTPTPMFFDPNSNANQLRLVEIEHPILNRILRLGREHDTKLTAVLHQVIARALSKALPDSAITNFVSQTAVNMRRSVGISSSEMGEFVSGCYIVHPRCTSRVPFTEAEWAAAAESSRKLALTSTKLHDQPIGLLRYAPSIRSWTLGKIGGRRDCSFEMSNLGSFDGGVDDAGGRARITKMFFTQPGHVMGPPLSFSFSTVRQGNLVCTVTWQSGALGVEGDEGEFVDELCATLKAELETLS